MKKLITLAVVLLSLWTCRKTPKTGRPDAWADYRKAYNFWKSNKDSAFFYFNRAAVSQPDKKQSALAYYNMSLIQSDAGDHYGAQESLTQSLRLLNTEQTKDRTNLAIDYDGLGMTFYDLNDYTQALAYYNLALPYAGDNALRALILNNTGNAYRGLKNYQRALFYYRQALRLTPRSNNDYARTLTNIAVTKWSQHHLYDASPELLTALAIRIRFNDQLGENSSYAHLADFYMDKKPDSAFFYARKMYAVAGKLRSPDDQLEALQKQISLSPPAEVKAYFRRYQTLSDSLTKSRNAAKNQFALIRYNVEKSRVENLQLQKENEAKKYQLILVLIIFVLGSVVAIFWYRKRKQRLQLEAENSIKQNQLVILRRVHDVISNGLHRVMSGIENQEEIQKEEILDEIELLYEQSRDLSYDKPGKPDHDFQGKIGRLLTGFGGPAVKIAVAGNSSQIWEKVDGPAREQLELILQELMVNMKKHSRATSVVVRFRQESDRICMDYMDNGIGFNADGPHGNGLTNTGNRIRELSGTIIFDTELNKGTKIYISVPFA